MLPLNIKQSLLAAFIALAVMIGYQTHLNARTHLTTQNPLAGSNSKAVLAASPAVSVSATKTARIKTADSLDSVTEPVKISIPSLGIKGEMVQVGLTRENEIAAPKNPDQVGWFEIPSSSGEPSPVVVVGHSGWINRFPAIFDKLNRIKNGDLITVTYKDGLSRTYTAETVRTYSPSAKMDEIMGDQGKSDILLVTCAGDWDPVRQEYAERLVVAASYSQ